MFENALFTFLEHLILPWLYGFYIPYGLLKTSFFKLFLLLHICNGRKESSPYSGVFESQRVQKKKNTNSAGVKHCFKDRSACINQ